jgi:Glu-tRNA(Gln) amidotransferase subunit E-like FAD-binding protein
MQPKNKRFFAVFKRYCEEARIDPSEQKEVRQGMIMTYFPEKSSFTQLTASEIDYLIHKMEEVLPKQTVVEKPEQKMRRKVIALLCETLDYRKATNGKIVPDMTRINNFCLEKTAFKRRLNDLLTDELRKVVTQIEKLRTNTIESNRKKMEVSDDSN